MLFVIWYAIVLGIYFEVGELKEIQNVLNNSTALELLPCPIDHYRRVFGMKIANLSSSILILFLCLCYFCYIVNKPRHGTNNEMKSYKRFVNPIVNGWTNFKSFILQRHKEEIVLEQI
jgi:hypothetical protein